MFHGSNKYLHTLGQHARIFRRASSVKIHIATAVNAFSTASLIINGRRALAGSIPGESLQSELVCSPTTTAATIWCHEVSHPAARVLAGYNRDEDGKVELLGLGDLGEDRATCRLVGSWHLVI